MSDAVTKIIWPNRGDSKKLRPHPYVTVQEIAPRLWETYQQHLYPGALWLTVSPLAQERISSAYAAHPYPYLMSASGRTFPAPEVNSGEFAVYMGPVKVHETNKAGIGVVAERHCFLIKGTRFLASSLMDFSPCSKPAE